MYPFYLKARKYFENYGRYNKKFAANVVQFRWGYMPIFISPCNNLEKLGERKASRLYYWGNHTHFYSIFLWSTSKYIQNTSHLYFCINHCRDMESQTWYTAILLTLAWSNVRHGQVAWSDFVIHRVALKIADCVYTCACTNYCSQND